MASCIHNHACICAYKLSYSSSWNIGFSISCTYNTQLRKKNKWRMRKELYNCDKYGYFSNECQGRQPT
jgi:hypothetical protein